MHPEIEVFPVAPDQWILVLDGYSSQCDTARDVPRAAHEASGYFGGDQSTELRLVDDRGAPWQVADAPAQVRRLGVDWSPTRGWSRFAARRSRQPCPVCGHGWSAHPPHHRECTACVETVAGPTPAAGAGHAACTVRTPAN